MTVLYLFALVFGLGCWLPAPGAERRDWTGFLFLQSWLALIVVLYVGDVLLGIALSTLAIGLAAAALLGLARRIRRTWPRHGERGAAIIAHASHPLWILFALVLAVTLAKGGIEYLPFPGDETASWLSLARQVFLVDAYWSDKVVHHLGAYTNGWPTLIAFANTIHGTYDDAHGAAVGIVMQLGVIGAAFDIIRYVVRQDAPGIEARARYLLALLGVLALLAVEASWVLVPVFQLIDEPMSFAVIGCFLTALLGLYPACDRRLVAIYLGLAFGATYILKIAALTFAPAALVIAAAFAYFAHRDQPGGRPVAAFIGFALVIFAPFAIANLTWQYFKTATECNASPLMLLTTEYGPAFRQPLTVAVGFIEALSRYLISFKWPLSLLAAMALAAGLMHARARWLAVAIAGFALAYTIAVYFAYLTCIDVVNLGGFEAMERYIRVALRVLHFMGPIVLLMTILAVPRFGALAAGLASNRWVRSTALAMIVVLLAWQVRGVARSIDDMRTRDHQDPVLKEAIVRVKAEAAALVAIIERRGASDPRTSLIAQGGYGVEYDLARYFGIKSRPDGGSNFFYTLLRPYSWAPDTAGAFTTRTDAETLYNYWRTFDIVWPYRTDAWTRSVINRLVADEACAANPERYFLLRTRENDHDGSFECVVKTP